MSDKERIIVGIDAARDGDKSSVVLVTSTGQMVAVLSEAKLNGRTVVVKDATLDALINPLDGVTKQSLKDVAMVRQALLGLAEETGKAKGIYDPSIMELTRQKNEPPVISKQRDPEGLIIYMSDRRYVIGKHGERRRIRE